MNSNVTTTDNNNGDEHEKRNLRNSNTGDRGFNDNFSFGRFVMREFIALDGDDWWAQSNDINEIIKQAKERAECELTDVVIYQAFRVAKPETKVTIEEFKSKPRAE